MNNRGGEKLYLLDMLPYTSGELHLGHVRLYTIGDALTRYYERRGFDVFHPVGWDAFGLPTDIAAERLGTTPAALTERCIAHMKPTLQRVGTRHDWSAELRTCAPEYYRWTQWLFLRLLERGLAYQAVAPANWCPSCETALANEQCPNGTCERCDSAVESREMTQWFLRMTRYADELLSGLDALTGWPDKVRAMQRNWIGRREHDGEVTYHIRDWSISRQRYWGAPVPIVHCEACGPTPVPDEELPVLLPPPERVGRFGGDPLARVPEFVHTACPRCGRPARRDTNTMDTFVCSSWYYLRYLSPHLSDAPFDAEAARERLPVDLYVGGVEHAILHLLYARFVSHALHDLGLVPCAEPFERLYVIGMLLKDGAKMSKSKGNVIDAADKLREAGADALRLTILFSAPSEADLDWQESRQTETAAAMRRFLARALDLAEQFPPASGEPGGDAAGVAVDAHTASGRLARATDRCINKTTATFEQGYAFNVAIASLMELLNAIEHERTYFNGSSTEACALRRAILTVPLLLAPFAPHTAEELWDRLEQPYSVHAQPWPEAAAASAGSCVEIPVQIDGKLRARVHLPPDAPGSRVESAAMEAARAYLGGCDVRKVIVVPGRIVNIVTDRRAPSAHSD